MSSISATFNVTGEGFCCGVGTKKTSYTYKYAVGSILYSCLAARKKGILEAISIKSVRLFYNRYGQITAIYKDKNNWLWNEYDLCIESNARLLAIAYFEAQQADLIKSLRNCGG